jgi:hypothetical protein
MQVRGQSFRFDHKMYYLVNFSDLTTCTNRWRFVAGATGDAQALRPPLTFKANPA